MCMCTYLRITMACFGFLAPKIFQLRPDWHFWGVTSDRMRYLWSVRTIFHQVGFGGDMATGDYWMPRIILVVLVIQGSLEVKLPTIWTDEKQRWKESEKRRRKKIKKRKSPKKEDPGARKGRKVANTVFFQWFVAQEGRKVGSLKRRVRSQLARWEMKNCTPFVARSTFRSQNPQNTPCSDHFWKLWCRKSARRCGVKHISRSKC